MRTTITLDEQLLAQLKKRAADSGTSVSALIAQGVRLLMKGSAASKRGDSFELVTFGAGGSFSRRNIDKTSSLLEDDDAHRFAR